MPKNNEQSLKEVVHELVEAYQMKGRLHEARIVNNWEKLMGKTINKYTKSIYIRNRTLYLKVESAPLKQELFYSKDKVIELLNKEVGEDLLEDVVIR